MKRLDTHSDVVMGDPFLSEDVVGLMPSDAKWEGQMHGTEEQCSDLTNVWLRWWCNALYLLKNVHSVMVVLDTSFEHSTTVDCTTLRYSRSRPQLWLCSKFNLRKCPNKINTPTWFYIGQALESSLKSTKLLDNVIEHPVYFGK